MLGMTGLAGTCLEIFGFTVKSLALFDVAVNFFVASTAQWRSITFLEWRMTFVTLRFIFCMTLNYLAWHQERFKLVSKDMAGNQ